MLKSKLLIQKEKNIKILDSTIKTYSTIDYRKHNNIYFNLNGNSTLYDTNIKRIATYIYKKEISKKNTYLKSIDIKINTLKDLKTRLNLIKKSYIDELRNSYIDILKENPISLYRDDVKINYFSLVNKLKDLKIIKKSNNVGFYIVMNFYLKFKDSKIFNKLISINNDIKHVEKLINENNDIYKQLKNYKLKINSYDLKLLERGIISSNIRENLYFYLTKLKKTKSFKVTNELNLKLKISELDFNTVLNGIRENLFKNEINNIIGNIPVFNNSIYENIINKYL